MRWFGKSFETGRSEVIACFAVDDLSQPQRLPRTKSLGRRKDCPRLFSGAARAV